MGLIETFSRIYLTSANIILLTVSIGLIAVGIAVGASEEIGVHLVHEAKAKLHTELEMLGLTLDTSNIHLNFLLRPLAFVITGLGVVIGSLSLSGCLGSVLNSKITLTAYVILQVPLIIFILVAFFDRSIFDTTFKVTLKDSLDDYSGIMGTNPTTVSWTAIMSYIKCCGVDGYEDFKGLDAWPPKVIGNRTVNLMTPLICCKVKSKDYSCAEVGTANSTNNWYKTGCYDKIDDLFNDNYSLTAFVLLLTTIQCTLLLAALLVICNPSRIGIL